MTPSKYPTNTRALPDTPDPEKQQAAAVGFGASAASRWLRILRDGIVCEDLVILSN